MIYPLYDFKKRENSNISPVLNISETARENLHTLNKTIYNLSSQYGEVLKTVPIMESLNRLANLHKNANEDLIKPSFVVTTIGTTSSGKSTFINSMLGARLSPMNADELSIGTLTFAYNDKFKNSAKITVDTQIANSHWENGVFNKTYADSYNHVKHVMDTYRKELQNETLSPPHITVETSYFVGNNPKFLGIDSNASIEVLELPWMIIDSESLDFVSSKVKASFVIFLIDYTVLFNKETRETNILFKKLMDMKNNIGTKDAILFVLNKADLKNYDDDELNGVIEKCRKEISDRIGNTHNIKIVPMNSLITYYMQSTYLSYENGNLKNYNPETTEADDNQKMFIELIKSNLKKCFKDQAKTISDIQDISEDFYNLIDQIKKNLKENKIPAFSVFEKLWMQSLKTSGAAEFYGALRQKSGENLNSLLLYLPLHKIIAESHNFWNLTQKQISYGKQSDQEHIEQEVKHLSEVYHGLKEKMIETRQELQELLNTSMTNLRRFEPKTQKEAINNLDIGAIDEILPALRKAVEKETIIPIEKAFIEEMRPDKLSKNLTTDHAWNDSYSKQLAEHFDFLRVKLFSEKKYIDEGRKFELSEGDSYEQNKLRDIAQQFENLCHFVTQAIEDRMKFEFQNTVDELSVRVNRWLIKRVREIQEELGLLVNTLRNPYEMTKFKPTGIHSIKHDYTFGHRIEIKPASNQNKEVTTIETGKPVKKAWYQFWVSEEASQTETHEKDVTNYESVRSQVTNWSSAIGKIEDDIWFMICDVLEGFFRKALESYDQTATEILENVNTIIRAENQTIEVLKAQISTKWNNIDQIYDNGTNTTKYLYELARIPEPEPEPIEVEESEDDDLTQELKQEPTIEEAIMHEPIAEEVTYEETPAPVVVLEKAEEITQEEVVEAAFELQPEDSQESNDTPEGHEQVNS